MYVYFNIKLITISELIKNNQCVYKHYPEYKVSHHYATLDILEATVRDKHNKNRINFISYTQWL